MKLKPTLLPLVLLTSAGILHAEKPATPAKTPVNVSATAPAPAPTPPPKMTTEQELEPRLERDGTLQLFAGPLAHVVGQVEKIVPLMAGQGEASSGTMPNLLWGPGTEDMMVPTDLRLRRVTPLQALTLVTAAAGCTLEPVMAPREETGNDPTRTGVVGYRVTRDASQPGELKPFDIKLPEAMRLEHVRKKLEVTKAMLGAQHPSVTQLQEELGRLEQTLPDVLKLTNDMRLTQGIKVVEPLRTTGTFRLEHPVPGVATASGTVTANSSAFTTAKNGASGTPAAADLPQVRIYAIGALLAGKAGGAAQHAQEQINELVTTALVQAEASSPGPHISFHDATKVIVAKGSSAQHEIISQVLTALKENQQVEAPGGKP